METDSKNNESIPKSVCAVEVVSRIQKYRKYMMAGAVACFISLAGGIYTAILSLPLLIFILIGILSSVKEEEYLLGKYKLGDRNGRKR